MFGLAALARWRDVETLLTCYTQPDRETMLSVIMNAKDVHEPELAQSRETADETATGL